MFLRQNEIKIILRQNEITFLRQNEIKISKILMRVLHYIINRSITFDTGINNFILTEMNHPAVFLLVLSYLRTVSFLVPMRRSNSY